MTDRELLELAAKAVGINLEWDGHPDEWQPMYYEGKTYHSFDPLTDDGDAFGLMVRLGITVSLDIGAINSTLCMNGNGGATVIESHGNDKRAATRLAIVKVAAEIGKTL